MVTDPKDPNDNPYSHDIETEDIQGGEPPRYPNQKGNDEIGR
jgi:hypothetical protein